MSGGAAIRARRTQEARRADSDRRMLRAAIGLIARHGVAGASLHRIGVEAGYSRALPAERFGSKLALLEAVVDASEDWFERRAAKWVEGLTGLAALGARVRAHLELVRDSAEGASAIHHLLVAAMGEEPGLRPRITALNAGYAAGLRRHLDEAKAAGELPAELDAERAASTLVACIHGCAIQALAQGDEAALGDDAAALIAMALHGLGAARDDADSAPRPAEG